jgi:DUF4097 and DUF4098 domain-containing protein YvlB
VEGPLVVDTSNGPVAIEAGKPVSLDVRTSNGGITFAGALDAGEATLETSNGAVELRLPADAAFTVDARTSASKATSDYAIVGSVEESALLGTVGAPEAAAATRLSIRTSNAPISLKQG